MKYKATITGLGECALDFLDECCNFIIIFNEDAPPELADISVLHTKSEVKEDRSSQLSLTGPVISSIG